MGIEADLLACFKDRLEARPLATVGWWLETDEVDPSNPLLNIAKLYRKEYRKTLPPPGGKKSPSHVQREIEEIRRAFERLARVLEKDLSIEAEEFLRSSGSVHQVEKWLPRRLFMSDFTLERARLSSPQDRGVRIEELKQVADLLGELPRVTGQRPPHAWLIRWVAARLRAGRKPKGHVLPIVHAIHYWATKECVSPEWGEEYLRAVWPKKADRGGDLAITARCHR